MKFTDLPDLERVPSTKRTAPTGTPDREAEARAKQSYTELVPKALNTEMARSDAITISKTEVSAATMSGFRTMRREKKQQRSYRHGGNTNDKNSGSPA